MKTFLKINEKYLTWKLERSKNIRFGLLVRHGSCSKKTEKAFEKSTDIKMKLDSVRSRSEMLNG